MTESAKQASCGVRFCLVIGFLTSPSLIDGEDVIALGALGADWYIQTFCAWNGGRMVFLGGRLGFHFLW